MVRFGVGARPFGACVGEVEVGEVTVSQSRPATHFDTHRDPVGSNTQFQ